MNRYLTTIVASLCLTAAACSWAVAQEYPSPQVVVSKDKVRQNGRILYSHVVKERQTLYSISKAYSVTIQEICDANPTLHLDTEGLKKDQIILIPMKEEVRQESVAETKAVAPDVGEGDTSAKDGSNDYFLHRVKWFEDLTSIAKKYSISKESIMNINGMTSEKLRRKDEIKIPTNPGKWERIASAGERTESESGKPTTEETSQVTSGEGILDKLFQKGKQETNATILLPFNAGKKADSQMMDFYSGALLAANDLGGRINLNVYDVAGGAMPVTEERFSESDFVIGPVSSQDIIWTVNASKGKTWIVSPLDQRAEALADTIPNVIQAPAPTSAQIRNMVRWIGSDLRNGDKVLMITQKGVALNGYSASVASEVRNSGIPHTYLSFNILEGRQVMGRIEAGMTDNGTNRVVIASDSKAFIIEVVRLLYLISSQKKNIVLYSTSKLRTFEEIDVEQLHILNLHASVSYYVDYDSKNVQDFLMRYRAIYNTEPSRSAFQGYDLMRFFSTMNIEYGRRWEGTDKLTGTGLQSDFRLAKTPRGGYVNEAIRRVVYNPDYSVNLVR